MIKIVIAPRKMIFVTKRLQKQLIQGLVMNKLDNAIIPDRKTARELVNHL
jgi:hypothetical protein